jgi:hypothetical protein
MERTLDRVSGSTSHMALLAMLAFVFSLLRFFLCSTLSAPTTKQTNRSIQTRPMRKAQKSTMSSLQFESRSVKNRSSKGVLYCGGECLGITKEV